MKLSSNERGQIKAPPESPSKKRRLGAAQLQPESHPGRGGLYGQESNSNGYSPNMPQKPSGPSY